MFHSKRAVIKCFQKINLSRSLNKKVELSPCIRQILENTPEPDVPIEINGWVASSRVSKNVAFLDIKDGTTFENVQCVVRPPTLLPQSIKNGTGLKVKGVWTTSRGNQKFEVQVTNQNAGEIEILGDVEELFPMIKSGHTFQYLRTIPEYRLRDARLGALTRFRSQVETSLVNYFDSETFIKTSPPIITASDCEGAGELFRIESNSKLQTGDEFFGKEAFLTVSTQLHLETLCAALNRVWTLTPCFRAEESDTNRHLSEFWMLEAEIAFVEDVGQLTTFSENMIKAVVKNLVDDYKGMGKNLLSTTDDQNAHSMVERWKMLLAKKWDSITYTDAINILQTAYDSKSVRFITRPDWGDSLKSEHEKWLAREHFQNPVFVTDYPLEEKAFYMKINEPSKGELGPTVACFDLLVPDIGELIGGSIREHDVTKLEKEIERRKMDMMPLQWYLNLRKNGSVPHGGFGMGFERLLLYLSHTENIRDVIPFPRSVNSCIC
ncbi:hypothetical protein CANINC_004436 [Pichia inconspicua]|uniref:Asparagine--tRNA ligase, mitochondrial n=1 Tax=Pichia inconspicua TaxID=52247 RepID=A0A4T0WVE8_9ASCO|nr:hypothetical protein CANINC_004436 [[Candida] inconspicua]